MGPCLLSVNVNIVTLWDITTPNDGDIIEFASISERVAKVEVGLCEWAPLGLYRVTRTLQAIKAGLCTALKPLSSPVLFQFEKLVFPTFYAV